MNRSENRGGGASIQPDTYRYKYDLGEMLEYFDGTQWLTAKVITRQYEEYTIEIARTKKQLEHVSEVMLRNTSVIIA